jgi:hypothetical protein
MNKKLADLKTHAQTRWDTHKNWIKPLIIVAAASGAAYQGGKIGSRSITMEVYVKPKADADYVQAHLTSE